MFKALFDESGIDRQTGYFLLCGFQGKGHTWRKFERDWSRVLREYNVEQFHAKDFYSRRPDGSLKGSYSHLDNHEANRFIADLEDCVPTHKLKTIGSIVNIDDFHSLSEDERRYVTGARWRNGKFTTSGAPSKPYFLAFEHCVAQACWSTPLPNKVALIFDQQDNFATLAIELYKYLSENHRLSNYR